MTNFPDGSSDIMLLNFQVESAKADSDDDMININGELSFTTDVMIRPTSGSVVSNEPSDVMGEGDLGLGATGSNRV